MKSHMIDIPILESNGFVVRRFTNAKGQLLGSIMAIKDDVMVLPLGGELKIFKGKDEIICNSTEDIIKLCQPTK